MKKMLCKRNIIRRILSFALTFAMCLTFMPTAVSAAGSADSDSIDSQETDGAEYSSVYGSAITVINIEVPPLVLGNTLPVPKLITSGLSIEDYIWTDIDYGELPSNKIESDMKYKLYMYISINKDVHVDKNSCKVYFNGKAVQPLSVSDTSLIVAPNFRPYKPSTGWVDTANGKWWYCHANGSYTCNAWEKIGGAWYHFDASGYMQTGWQKLGNVWYFFNGGGAMQTGWQKLGNVWYYFNGNGAMQTGWQKISNAWYYFNGNGAMQTGWQKISNAWYYFNGNGAMQSAKWIDSIYYVAENGAMVTSAYIKDGSKYYWVGANGKYTRTYSSKDTSGYTIYDQSTGKKV